MSSYEAYIVGYITWNLTYGLYESYVKNNKQLICSDLNHFSYIFN